ncbi:hypothetical protein ES703_88066 [subsurface metagenome]
MSLDVIEEKWMRKTMNGFRKVWAQNVAAADTFSAFCEGISAATGIPSGTIAASLPASNYKEFQSQASKYLPIAIAKIEAAFRTKKWSRNYRRAFGG